MKTFSRSPETTTSIDDFKHALGFVDSFSRLGAVYLLRTGTEVGINILRFIADLGKPRKILITVTDDAKENLERIGKPGSFVYSEKLTCEYTPEQNRKQKRVWGNIGAMGRCLLKTAGLPESFWSFAYRAAFHIETGVFTLLMAQHPSNIFDKTPVVSHFRVFECLGVKRSCN